MAVSYLERLTSDLRQDTASLAYLVEGLSRKGDALRSIQAASREEAELASALLQAEQYGWGQFTFNGTTFEDLRSTGNLRLIHDGLRAVLVDYYETWAFEQGRISSRRSELPALVFKLVPIEFAVADVPLRGWATIDENQSLDLRQLGNVDLPSLMNGIKSAEFRRELQHELNYTGFAHTALARLHASALEVLRLLESDGA